MERERSRETTGSLTVLHGIPDFDTDVYADGELIIDEFEYGVAFGPLTLPGGDHTVETRSAGSAPTGEPHLAGPVPLPAGASVTVVTHLAPTDEPTLTTFVDDMSPVEMGRSRVVVRHTAPLDAVDVVVGAEIVLHALTSGGEETLVLLPGEYDVVVRVAGETTEAFAEPLTFQEGTAYFLHVVGHADGDVEILGTMASSSDASPARTDERDAGLDGDGRPRQTAWVGRLGGGEG